MRGRLAMRRRYLFPAILVGASVIWSGFAGLANSPAKQYEYLNALVVDDRYAFGTAWIKTDVPNIEKLSEIDEVLLVQLLESFDNTVHEPTGRKLFLDQAEADFQTRQCDSSKKRCELRFHLNRKIEPSYVHGDLRLIQARISSIVQEVSLSEEQVEFISRTEETRQLRFMFTDRGWVIRAAEVIAETPIALRQARPLEIDKMSGLNYYPRTAPWDKFWPAFPVDVIETDLDAVKALGANSVRIFLQHDYFSNLETQADGLARLSHFLEMCKVRDIKVIVTMFDLRGDYRFQNWSRDSRLLSTILDKIQDHPALLGIDLKNQPDLDFEGSNQLQVTAWLEAMILSARQSHANVPLTIGWSDPKYAALLSDHLNFVSFHDYNNPEGLSARLAGVKARVGDKPVFITEIGHSRWSPLGDKSKRQAERLSDQLDQIGKANGVFVWTLHDFDQIGSNIVGRRPWRKAQQKAFGITQSDGSWRASAQIFHDFNQTFHANP